MDLLGHLPAHFSHCTQKSQTPNSMGKNIFQVPGRIDQGLVLQPEPGLVFGRYLRYIEFLPEIQHLGIPQRAAEHFVFLIKRFDISNHIPSGSISGTSRSHNFGFSVNKLQSSIVLDLFVGAVFARIPLLFSGATAIFSD
jgi:hypothetical protein